jgi:carboxyl-terminal processing protease
MRLWGWAAVAVLGLVAAAGHLRAQDDLKAELDRFALIFYYVRNQYVEPVDNDVLIEGAIEGMLKSLDPHSVYMPRDRYAQFTEQFREDFSGIGIQFDIRHGELVVVSPLEGTPAYRLGIRAGDRIVSIDGEEVENSITNTDVRRMLRGPEGSPVEVAVQRPGESERRSFHIVRARIPQESVLYSHMIRPGIGYVRVLRFAAGTGRELEDALDELRSQGMKQLVLDLRLNSGGLLQQAIEVSNLVLPAGDKIVYTRGRAPAASADYYADEGGPKFTDEPLVVLIDHGSASASEILAGAVQDLDRGLVVGTTSFGKGLVQNQMKLRDGSALLLTVAKYYTPSGRLIQRDYSDRDAYREDVWEQDAEPESVLAGRPKYETPAGRTVYGGGGITPDVIISSPRLNAREVELEQSNVFFESATRLAPGLRARYPDVEKFLTEYEPDAAAMQDLSGEIVRAGIELAEGEQAEEGSYIRRRLKAEIAGNLFGREAAYRVDLTGDGQVQEALQLFPEASRLLTLSQTKMPAQRN